MTNLSLSLVQKLSKFTYYSENQNPTYYSKSNASIFSQLLITKRRKMLLPRISSLVLVSLVNFKIIYCDLRGRIKGNAQSLYHVMNVGHVSVQYQHTRAIIEDIARW